MTPRDETSRLGREIGHTVLGMMQSVTAYLVAWYTE